MEADSVLNGPLAGLSVVELGDGTSAPYSAKMFGDLGADVVKVELPHGDSSRRRGPFPGRRADPEASGLFMYLNINKYGVCLDPDGAEGFAALHQLLAGADVFITNMPFEWLAQRNISAASLRARYPNLVVSTISPFGREGPGARRKGNELVVYAMAGMAYSTPGMPDASEDLYKEPPLHPSCYVAETIAGLTAATASMTAITGRQHTGTGCHVDVSAHAAVAAMQIRDIMNSSYSGGRYNRLLNPVTIGRMPNFYLPCKDGYVTVAAPMDVHWQRLVEAMQSPAWALSEDYATGAARTKNWEALRLKLIEWTMTLSGDELHRLAEKSQLPIFPFYTIKKMAESEHSRERRTLVEVEIGGGNAKIPAAPYILRKTPWALRRPAPRLGEHNDIVLDKKRVCA